MELVQTAHHLRGSPRYKLFQPTEMSTAGGTARVHLLNLSTGGALVHADVAPRPGALISIKCGADRVSATVAWTAGRKFGVSFDVALPQTLIEHVIGDQQLRSVAASRQGQAIT